MTLLEVYVLLSPLLVLAIALGVARISRWLDEREERRQAR
jgi:hypothetical protein